MRATHTWPRHIATLESAPISPADRARLLRALSRATNPREADAVLSRLPESIGATT